MSGESGLLAFVHCLYSAEAERSGEMFALEPPTEKVSSYLLNLFRRLSERKTAVFESLSCRAWRDWPSVRKNPKKMMRPRMVPSVSKKLRLVRKASNVDTSVGCLIRNLAIRVFLAAGVPSELPIFIPNSIFAGDAPVNASMLM